MINNKQKELLKSKGYQILDEINFIKPSDVEPNIRIVYDNVLKIFTIQLVSTTLTDNVIEEFMLILLERSRLIMKLNLLGKESD